MARGYNARVDFPSSYYRLARQIILSGEDPCIALQRAARRIGRVVVLPEALAAYLQSCTTAEAVALVERAGERAAEREIGEAAN